MSQFMKGKELCRRFFFEIAKPILDQNFSDLRYSAGLLGYGSDVLGYDDETSTDHMWGPRFYLFLSPEDERERKEEILKVFGRNLPYTYHGYSVHFSAPDPNDHGVRHAQMIDSGEVCPLIFIETADHFLQDYIGLSEFDDLEEADWLSFSEHRLLALQKREFYQDDFGLSEKLLPLSYYPEPVRLYLIASNWAMIGMEQAFVKRCGSCGDEIGSRIICARIAEGLIRLCFLYCKQYAPYSKWFGTAFSYLPISSELKDLIGSALATDSLKEREHALVQAQALVGELHNQSGVTEPVSFSVTSYFNRDIQVIYADRFADAVSERLKGTSLERLPRIGSFSGVGNFTELSDSTFCREQIKKFYQSF